MGPLASLNAYRNRKARENSHEQIDLFDLMLQIQTLSLQLDDVRSRLAQVERQLNIHHLSQEERASLSKLSRIG
ncbi:MAG TPA: hypothetical protein VH684_07105 [Xanthobacteraceae bacterium]|jgi:hypothetical protein